MIKSSKNDATKRSITDEKKMVSDVSKEKKEKDNADGGSTSQNYKSILQKHIEEKDGSISLFQFLFSDLRPNKIRIPKEGPSGNGNHLQKEAKTEIHVPVESDEDSGDLHFWLNQWKQVDLQDRERIENAARQIYEKAIDQIYEDEDEEIEETDDDIIFGKKKPEDSKNQRKPKARNNSRKQKDDYDYNQKALLNLEEYVHKTVRYQYNTGNISSLNLLSGPRSEDEDTLPTVGERKKDSGSNTDNSAEKFQVRNLKKRKELHLDMAKAEKKILGVLHELRRLELEAELLDELAIYEKLQLAENEEMKGDQSNRRGESSLFSLFSTDTTSPAVRSKGDSNMILQIGNSQSKPNSQMGSISNENEEDTERHVSDSFSEQNLNHGSLDVFMYDAEDEDEFGDWIALADQKYLIVQGVTKDMSHSNRLEHPDFQDSEKPDISSVSESEEINGGYMSFPSSNTSSANELSYIYLNASSIRFSERTAIDEVVNVTVQKETYPYSNRDKIISFWFQNNHSNNSVPSEERQKTFIDTKRNHTDYYLSKNRLGSSALFEEASRDLFLTKEDFEYSHAYDILDLGCGKGDIGIAFNSMADKIIGVDLSPNSLGALSDYNLLETDILHSAQSGKSPYSYFLIGDIEDVIRTLPDESQDIIIASDSLRLLGGLELLFLHAHRLLRSQILRNSFPNRKSSDGFMETSFQDHLARSGGLFICDLLFFAADPEIESEFFKIKAGSKSFHGENERGGTNYIQRETDKEAQDGKHNLDYILHRDLYYIHSPSYVVSLATKNGFQLIDFSIENVTKSSFPSKSSSERFHGNSKDHEYFESNKSLHGHHSIMNSEKNEESEVKATRTKVSLPSELSSTLNSPISKIILVFEKLEI